MDEAKQEARKMNMAVLAVSSNCKINSIIAFVHYSFDPEGLIKPCSSIHASVRWIASPLLVTSLPSTCISPGHPTRNLAYEHNSRTVLRLQHVIFQI